MTVASSQALFEKYETMGAYHWRECDRRSNIYNPPLAARYEMVLRHVPRGRALDIGAGDGYLTGRLARICDEVVGLEYEPSGVQLAQQMLADYSNVAIRQGDAYELPFETGAFDAVVMADVIEHLDRPAAAVAEMARVVVADGAVLVTTPHWRSDRVWDPRHVKEYTADEFRALLSKDFGSVELIFAWPKVWSNFYNTRIGWRLMRLVGRLGFNPFSKESRDASGSYQMLAICREPLRSTRG